MPSARAKSGPSGITIMKSRMLTNWIAPTRNTMKRSDRGTSPAAAAFVPGVPGGSGLARPASARTSFLASTSGLPFALAQRAELLERRAAEEGIRPCLVADRGGGGLAVVVTGVDPRLLGQLHQPL